MALAPHEELIYRNSKLPLHSGDTRWRYCDKCQVFKLPRMHHCSVCNRCCVRYDHHCPLAMNCIGINNFHLFITFLSSTIFVSHTTLISSQFVLYSTLINLKNSFIHMGFAQYSLWAQVFSVVLLFQNLYTAYYA